MTALKEKYKKWREEYGDDDAYDCVFDFVEEFGRGEMLTIMDEWAESDSKSLEAKVQAIEAFVAFLQAPDTVSTSLEANKEIFIKKLKGEKMPY